MTENEIRPAHLKSEQEMLFLNDVKRLMSYAADFVDSDCPACKSAPYTVKFTKYAMRFVSCNNCRTVYANPRPKPEHIQDYYLHSENYKFWAEKIFPLTEDVRREKMVKPRVSKVKSLVQQFGLKSDVLVEVGPGFGTFCDELRKEKIFSRIIPIEPTPELADSLRNKGFEVIEEFIENVQEENFADMVVAFEVIEHMLNPIKFVATMHQMLKKGGVLMMTCPNAEGMDMLVLQEHAPGVDVEHVTLLNPYSIKLLLQHNGFEIITIETPGQLDLDIIRNRLEASIELRRANPFLSHVLFERDDVAENFQKFVVENRLSGNMLSIARKL